MPDEATSLRLPQGVPVFRVLRTVYASGNRPVQVQESVAAADRHGFRYEVDMRRVAMTARLRIGACLSLSGRFAQFGQQAARGLDAWRSLDGAADVLVEDDRSDRRELEELLPGVAAHCDLLLGPYSTQLMRTAGKMAAQSAWLPRTHGGPGDDVAGARPGHVATGPAVVQGQPARLG